MGSHRRAAVVGMVHTPTSAHLVISESACYTPGGMHIAPDVSETGSNVQGRPISMSCMAAIVRVVGRTAVSAWFAGRLEVVLVGCVLASVVLSWICARLRRRAAHREFTSQGARVSALTHDELQRNSDSKGPAAGDTPQTPSTAVRVSGPWWSRMETSCRSDRYEPGSGVGDGQSLHLSMIVYARSLRHQRNAELAPPTKMHLDMNPLVNTSTLNRQTEQQSVSALRRAPHRRAR